MNPSPEPGVMRTPLQNEKRFPKFTAVVYHCSKGFRRRKLKSLFVRTLKDRAKKAVEKKAREEKAKKVQIAKPPEMLTVP